MESFTNFRYLLSHNSKLHERSLARELRDRRDKTASARKRDNGGESFDEKQFRSPTEGGGGPSGENFKDKAEDGGDRGTDNEEEDCQGSKCEPSANRARRSNYIMTRCIMICIMVF